MATAASNLWAIRDELEDTVAVLDAFHVVKLGLQAMEETRRRVQQEQLGHRGRKNDPLYRIRNALRAGTEKLTDRQIDRIDAGLQAGDPGWEVIIAWQAYQRLRSASASKDLRHGHKITTQVLESFPSCPVPEIARLGRTLRSWSQQFLAYFTTGRANNGGTEAVNGNIELHRRIARSFRKPGQLPTTDDPRCRPAHPPKSPMSRFAADRNWFASWTGTAPLEASSGEQNRHRLSWAGNRRMNHMIRIAAISQIRLDTPGRGYYRRKLAAGKNKPTRLRRYGLIIVDEVGYLPFEQDAANLFFQLVSSCYEHAPLILISNLPFSGWGGVFGDEAVGAAMIDRVVQHADILTLKDASYRLRNRGIDTLPSIRDQDTAD